MEEGVERISSKDLSERMKVTASQIRQDLNNFGGFGQQGYGYNVEYLHSGIGRILGLEETHNMVLIGMGNIGRALTGYLDAARDGFRLLGIFDSDRKLANTEIAGRKVRMMDDLPAFIRENGIEVGVIAVPKEHAMEVADILVGNGVRAIWNFALIDLNLYVPGNVVVENVHLSDSLMRLSYSICSRLRREE
jgi:redox-sensing transcriptional repressor